MTKREIVTDLNDNQRICIKTCLDFPISTFLFTLLLGENSGNRENLHDRLLRNVYTSILHNCQIITFTATKKVINSVYLRRIINGN